MQTCVIFPFYFVAAGFVSQPNETTSTSILFLDSAEVPAFWQLNITNDDFVKSYLVYF